MPSVMLHQPIETGHEFRQLDQVTETRLREIGATLMPVRSLRRTGRRPFLFNGTTVATLCGITPLLPFWYEINVHRTVIDSYVSDIRLFHNSPDVPDLYRVAEHDDLEDTVVYFERYEPAADVAPPAEMSVRASSCAELALAIARLQLQVDQVTQHFHSLVGDLLHTLSPKPS